MSISRSIMVTVVVIFLLVTTSCSADEESRLVADCGQIGNDELFGLHMCLLNKDGDVLHLDYLVEIQGAPLDEETTSLESRIVPVEANSKNVFQLARSAPEKSLSVEAIEVSIYKSRNHLDQFVEPVDLLVCEQCQGWSVGDVDSPSDIVYEISAPSLDVNSVVVLTIFTFDDVGVIMKSWAVEVK